MAARSEQLRQEAEQNRAQLVATLEELRDRITPGEVVDQLIDYAGRSGGSEFFRNLGRQAVNNPLPVVLMGAGIGWLILSGARRAPPFARTGGPDAAAGNTLDRWGTAATETAGELRDTAANVISRSVQGVRSAAADLAGETSGWIGHNRGPDPSDAGDEAASSTTAPQAMAKPASDRAAAAYDRAQAMTRSAAQAGRGLADFCAEHPLVLGGLGLAVGAALGAMLPSNRMEGAVSGDAGREIEHSASELPRMQEENVPTVPALPDRPAGAVERAPESWHGAR
jgi:ElaB/YqjD/DUF883 family membrane-anchored ribosome-binding protein